jgi:hypothetical protein
MENLKCPLCATNVTVAVDRAAWFETGKQPVILWHTPGPRAILDGRAVTHYGSPTCLATGCTPELAEGIAADRAAGVHLAAHP